MTLETTGFFFGAAALRGAALATVARLFDAAFTGVAFFADLTLAGFLADAFAAVARFALGLEAALALTERFAVLADDRFVAERAVDRRKPFVRLLLIVADLKRLLNPS